MAFEYRPTMGRPLKEVLADLTFMQKVKYIWQFYKMYILALAAPVLILIVSLLWSSITKTETLYNGIGVSVSVTAEGEKYLSDGMFETMGGTNHKKQTVGFREMDIFSTDSVMESDTGSSNVMSIAAWMAVGDLDYMMLSEDSFDFYKGDIFADLEDLLSQEQQTIWKERFVQMPVGEDDTFCGALDITDTAFAKKYIESEGKIYLAFPGKAKRTDKLDAFLNHILSLEE